MRTETLALNLLENEWLTGSEQTIANNIVQYWVHTKKQLSLTQQSLLEGFLARVNLRKQKSGQFCPVCGGKLINAVYYIGGKGHINYLECENVNKYDDNYNSRCEYARKNMVIA